MEFGQFPGEDDFAIAVDFGDVLESFQNSMRRFIKDQGAIQIGQRFATILRRAPCFCETKPPK